jgi:hypothetical protein
MAVVDDLKDKKISIGSPVAVSREVGGVPIGKEQVVIAAGSGDFADAITGGIGYDKAESLSVGRPAQPVGGCIAEIQEFSGGRTVSGDC